MHADRTDGGIQVMEHREPPRIAASDRRFDGAIENPASRFRLRAFDPSGSRPRIDAFRLGLASLAALAVAATLVFLGSRATSAAVGWLHRQSQYQLAFDNIQLVQQPPRWFRGGRREFLSRVRRSSGNSARISQLEVRPDRLATAFKLDPWVEEVIHVSYAPGRISVDLKFREPVAWVKLASRRQQLVDGLGRVLPSEDVDVELLDPLMKITGEGLTAPADPRAGVVWKSKAGGSEVDEVDERIVAAAGLARFLRRECQGAGPSGSSALRMVEIIVTDLADFGKRGLFMLNSEGTEFCWGSAPGSERPREPTAQEKWQILLRWSESSAEHTLAPEDYWDFSQKGLSHVCPRTHRPRHIPRSAPR
jgi:hypothetical protein